MMRVLLMTAVVASFGCIVDEEAEDDVAEAELESHAAGQEVLAVVSSTHGADVNRAVPALLQQFLEMKDHGDYYGYYVGAGYPDTNCGTFCDEHWQGMARLAYPAAAANHLVVASSDDSGAWAAVIPTRAASGLRLRGNQHRRTSCTSTNCRDWNTIPEYEGSAPDTIAHAELINSSSCWNHPGGMQALGQYLFVALESIDGCATGNDGAVTLLDVGGLTSTFHNPINRWKIEMPDADGMRWAAAAKLAPLTYLGEASSRYLMLTGDGDELIFNVSRLGVALSNACAFSTGCATTTAELKIPYPTGEDYQNCQLLVSSSSSLLHLMCQGRSSGTDFIDLFLVEISLADSGTTDAGIPPLVATVTQFDTSKIMWCTPSVAEVPPFPQVNGRQGCDFSAAAAVHVDPAGRLYYYATVHDDTSLNGSSTQWTRLMEFRPRNHIDDPGVAGETTCSLTRSWVNLYDGVLSTSQNGNLVPTGLNSYIVDYEDRSERLMSSFGKAYNFNDRVRSVQWCLPSGYRFRLFSNDGFGGSTYDLNGNGLLQTKEWTSTQGWSSGCFQTTASSLCSSISGQQ